MKRVAFLIIPALIFSACSLLPAKDQPSTKDESDTSQATPDDPLSRFTTAFSDIGSFIVTAVTTDASGAEISTAIIKYQSPDKTHISTTTTDGTSEFISTAEGSYMRQGEGEEWLMLPTGESDPTINFFNKTDIEAEFTQENLPTYLGKKACGEYTCHVYQQVEEGATTNIYFDTTTFLPRLITTTVTSGETTSMTYEYTDVTIDVPTNAVAMPSFEDIDPDNIDATLDQLENYFGQ